MIKIFDAEKLKKARKDRKLSRERYAQELKIALGFQCSQSRISAIEHGKCIPSSAFVGAIAVFEKKAVDFFYKEITVKQ